MEDIVNWIAIVIISNLYSIKITDLRFYIEITLVSNIRSKMNIEKKNQQRKDLNQKLSDNDVFFRQFGELDDDVYADGAIPKKYKELTGLSISVLTRCEECILYHLQGCLDSGANKKEIMEAIKIGVIGGGSITYPSARYAIKLFGDLIV